MKIRKDKITKEKKSIKEPIIQLLLFRRVWRGRGRIRMMLNFGLDLNLKRRELNQGWMTIDLMKDSKVETIKVLGII